MTVRRFRMGGSGGSPFRSTVSGVDAAGALFDEVLFDANQAPLRLWSRGYASFDTSEHIPAAAVGQAIVKWASARPTTPAGTNPLFAVMWRCQKQAGSKDGTIQHVTPGYHGLRLVPNNQQGGGGAIMGTDGLYIIDWCRRDAGYYYPNYVNFAILRNVL